MTIAPLLHPRLHRLPPGERRALVRAARSAPFDILELVAMAVALIAAMLVLRGAVDELPAFSLEGALAGAAVVGATAAALLVRRTRRGLHRLLGEGE